MVKSGEGSISEVAERWIEDALTPKASEVPDVVYHYTDAAGLMGMLTHNVVWATDHRFLNDKSEYEYTKDIVKELIATRSATGGELEPFLNRVSHYQDFPSPDDTFIFSLTSEQDDLSQWRAYAREGLGFTVGFDGRAISKGSGAEVNYRFCKVEYERNAQIIGLDRALAEMELYLVSALKDNAAEASRLIEDAAVEFDRCWESRASANKHGSFKSEEEWRVVAFVNRSVHKNIIKTRVSGQRLVNYIELSIGTAKSRKLPIVEIGIGPGFTEAGQAIAVEALCQQTGYKPLIYPADTPYRRI